MPFSSTYRPSPNGMSPALSVSSFSTEDTRISPPRALAVMRAAKITFLPKKSSDSLITSPVWSPMRTRIGSSGWFAL